MRVWREVLPVAAFFLAVPDDVETDEDTPEEQAASTRSIPRGKRAKLEEDRRLAEQETEQQKTLQKYYQEMSKCR